MKRIALIAIILTLALTIAAEGNLQKSVFIIYRGDKLEGENRTIAIPGFPVEILVENLTEEIPVQIFIYITDEFFDRYHLPVDVEDTAMFAAGTGMAAMVDEETKAGELYINIPGSHNYIYSGRRLNGPDSAKIVVTGFSDIMEIANNAKTCYLTLFADYNGDRIIQKGELANLTVTVP